MILRYVNITMSRISRTPIGTECNNNNNNNKFLALQIQTKIPGIQGKFQEGSVGSEDLVCCGLGFASGAMGPSRPKAFAALANGVCQNWNKFFAEGEGRKGIIYCWVGKPGHLFPILVPHDPLSAFATVH